MEQAAAQDQTHDVIYASLGDAYLGAKKYPEAETAYNKAIALAPPTSKSLGSYHSGLALALMKQGKTESSMAECDKAAPARSFHRRPVLFQRGRGPHQSRQAGRSQPGLR